VLTTTVVTIAAVVFAAVETPPVPSNTSGLVVVLLALIGGGVLTFLFNAYREKKYGPLERKQREDTLLKTANEAAKDMLAAQRGEIEAARADVIALREQVHQQDLKIAELQASLEHSKEDRDRLQQELMMAVERRTRMEVQVEGLKAKIETLELLVEKRADADIERVERRNAADIERAEKRHEVDIERAGRRTEEDDRRRPQRPS
jgi:uncharacterized protein (DUF3084 family)